MKNEVDEGAAPYPTNAKGGGDAYAHTYLSLSSPLSTCQALRSRGGPKSLTASLPPLSPARHCAAGVAPSH